MEREITKDFAQVLAQIDREELADLALSLGNIDSPGGQEYKMAEFLEAWLKREGFKTRVLALLPERPNIAGTYEGTGGGYSLLFNSHMDTSPGLFDACRVRDPAAKIFHQAWREGDTLVGRSIVNDKGPMACFLIAAKAIKKAGITLKGDLIVTGVSAEIGWSPVDEFRPPQWLGHEVGARFMVGQGVIADYALVAEATSFRLTWLEAGKANFKITVFGSVPGTLYSCYLKGPYAPEKHPSAIIQATRLIEKIEEWGLEYEKKNTYDCPGGTLIPKVSVGAIRGGAPYIPANAPEVCTIYVACWIAPGQDAVAIKAELKEIIRSLGLDAEIEMYRFIRGYEAQNIDRLRQTIERTHVRLFNEKLGKVVGPECSMWRDINIFNEVGIPAASYGPAAGAGGGANSVELDDLYQAAQAYAMIALDLCNQEKKARS